MAKIKIIHDTVGETLTIYFAEPNEHQICEETEHSLILIKDERTNEVVGLEKFNYKPNPLQPLIIESETFTERG